MKIAFKAKIKSDYLCQIFRCSLELNDILTLSSIYEFAVCKIQVRCVAASANRLLLFENRTYRVSIDFSFKSAAYNNRISSIAYIVYLNRFSAVCLFSSCNFGCLALTDIWLECFKNKHHISVLIWLRKEKEQSMLRTTAEVFFTGTFSLFDFWATYETHLSLSANRTIYAWSCTWNAFETVRRW